mmetsp:Transcript_34021/g.55109  ORF Transcript_34021/g.55109 Transcript_34021/m.55109 type:complete len:304 (-) Transcript_34021:755-1666(-)
MLRMPGICKGCIDLCAAATRSASASACTCSIVFAVSCFRLGFQPFPRNSIVSFSINLIRGANLTFSDISFMRPKYLSIYGFALTWSICSPIVASSLHRHSMFSSRGFSFSPSKTFMHSCMIFSVNNFFLNSSPINRILPSMRSRCFRSVASLSSSLRPSVFGFSCLVSNSSWHLLRRIRLKFCCLFVVGSRKVGKRSDILTQRSVYIPLKPGSLTALSKMRSRRRCKIGRAVMPLPSTERICSERVSNFSGVSLLRILRIFLIMDSSSEDAGFRIHALSLGIGNGSTGSRLVGVGGWGPRPPP